MIHSAVGKVLGVKSYFFHSFFIDILPLGSGSVDLHIFADPDPDPGRQNVADLPDRVSKHYYYFVMSSLFFLRYDQVSGIFSA